MYYEIWELIEMVLYEIVIRLNSEYFLTVFMEEKHLWGEGNCDRNSGQNTWTIVRRRVQSKWDNADLLEEKYAKRLQDEKWSWSQSVMNSVKGWKNAEREKID